MIHFVSSISDINDIEKQYHGRKHLVVFLLFQKWDYNTGPFNKCINFLDSLDSSSYCSIYLLGSFKEMSNELDSCSYKIHLNSDNFENIKRQLKNHIPSIDNLNDSEIIFAQGLNLNSKKLSTKKDDIIAVNFQNYIRLNIFYGYKHNYIDSIETFLGNVLQRTNVLVEKLSVITEETNNHSPSRISLKRVVDPSLMKCAPTSDETGFLSSIKTVDKFYKSV